MNNDFPQLPRIKYRPDNPTQECEDRLYWQKRFNLAAWAFLLWAFWLILFTDSNPRAIWFSLAVSFGFRIWNSICRTRHMIWHMRNDRGEDDAHL